MMQNAAAIPHWACIVDSDWITLLGSTIVSSRANISMPIPTCAQVFLLFLISYQSLSI